MPSTDCSAKPPCSDGAVQAPTSWSTWAYRLAIALSLAWFAAVCLRGIGSPWQWGHNGYNGAAFSQAARNSLRFNLFGQALYYTGLDRPPADALYTHHPMMLHAHLVVMEALLGPAEWVHRLVPAFYSFMDLALLVILARRTFGRLASLLTALVYALTPLPLIFANMIDHEQGCIAWTLLMFLAFQAWQRSGRWPWLLLCLLATAMDAQWDWAAYYFMFFLALFALGSGLRQGRPWLRWRPAWTFLLVYTLIVLASFLGFFLWIQRVRGGLTEMGSAFAGRSSSPDSYFIRLWSRSLDLQGPLVMLLGGLWLPWLVWRVRKGQAHFGDFVAACFVVGQTIHSLVFKQAGFIHCYWTFYAVPAVALGGGALLAAAAKQLAATCTHWLSHRSRLQVGLRTVVALLLLVPLIVAQSRFAWAQLQWGAATGSASYVVPYDSQWPESRFFEAVAGQYRRGEVHYLVHSSLQTRIELEWYLDGPIVQIDDLDAAKVQAYATEPERPPSPKAPVPEAVHLPAGATVLLVDLAHVEDRRHVVELAAGHAAQLYDHRFVAVDITSPPKPLVSLRSIAQPSSPAWRWFVHSQQPPLQWQVVSPPELPIVAIDPQAHTTEPGLAGGKGGTALRWTCPLGQVLSGLSGRVNRWGKSQELAEIQPKCRSLRLGPDNTMRTGSPTELGPRYGDQDEAGHFDLRCPDEQLPVGLYGHASEFTDSIGILCAPQAVAAPDRGGIWHVAHAPLQRTAAYGGKGNPGFVLSCPEHTLLWGIKVRAASLVDALGPVCAPLTADFLAGISAGGSRR